MQGIKIENRYARNPKGERRDKKHCVLNEVIHNYISQADSYTLYPGICEYSDSSLLSPRFFSTEEWEEVSRGTLGYVDPMK